MERLSPAEVVEDWHGSGGCAELKKFPPEDREECPLEEALSHPKISVGRERVDFWWSVCQNAAASEIVVNLALPWFLCDVQAGVIQPPEMWWLNFWVLILNLWSSYMEGYTKSVRLLTQTQRRTSVNHYTVFIAANGFCYGFLNVSSSFPDVGEGGSDIAIATGSIFAGSLFVLINMVGSIFFYGWGRNSGWRDLQKQSIFNIILRFGQLLPALMSTIILAGFVFAAAGREEFGTCVPLDAGDPDVVGGLENARRFFDAFSIKVSPRLIGLAFGVAMSTLGVIFATLLVDVWFDDHDRPLARLIGNLVSTIIMLILQHIQDQEALPNFFLMKFNSSFCGGLSAFSGTMGEVFDQFFGAAEEELFEDEPPDRQKGHEQVWWWPDITGWQNFAVHWVQTMLIMMFCMRYGPDDQDPPPRIVLSESRRLGFVRETSAEPWEAAALFR